MRFSEHNLQPEQPWLGLTLATLRDRIDQEARQIRGNNDPDEPRRDLSSERRVREIILNVDFLNKHTRIRGLSVSEASADSAVKSELWRNNVLELAVVSGFLDPEQYNEHSRYVTDQEKCQLELNAVQNGLKRRISIRKNFGTLLPDWRNRVRNMEATDLQVRRHVEENTVSFLDLSRLLAGLENLNIIADCVDAGVFTITEVNRQLLLFRTINNYPNADPEYKGLISGIRLVEGGLRWGFIKNHAEYLSLLRHAAHVSR